MNKKIVEILRTVPFENGFHFYESLGNFTLETATNLESFEKKLQIIVADSVSSSSKRGLQEMDKRHLRRQCVSQKNKSDKVYASN